MPGPDQADKTTTRQKHSCFTTKLRQIQYISATFLSHFCFVSKFGDFSMSRLESVKIKVSMFCSYILRQVVGAVWMACAANSRRPVKSHMVNKTHSQQLNFWLCCTFVLAVWTICLKFVLSEFPIFCRKFVLFLSQNRVYFLSPWSGPGIRSSIKCGCGKQQLIRRQLLWWGIW